MEIVRTTYGAADHLAWWLDQDVVHLQLQQAGEAGRRRRNRGPSWRELGRRDWYLHAAAQVHDEYRRPLDRLAAGLPPRLRSLVPLIALNRDVIGHLKPVVSARIRGDQALDLQALCLRRVQQFGRGSGGLAGRERERLRQRLLRIDPEQRPLLRVSAPSGVEFLPGQPVAFHATHAVASNMWEPCASSMGRPVLAEAVRREGRDMTLTPLESAASDGRPRGGFGLYVKPNSGAS